ncbi:dynein regulatory complex protein 9 isoform X3 [Erinaceus europaeus]|uniref:Dynein regulatory complex protein 9 isoform X3 n=1 Tax=Erinaceus europaeus TaxID=9365 RepID=A0A1S3WV92_ERIEU|nr:dynein regulatory complex protein 9 isoform X3 [Erinaceus europaeus]
MTSKSADAEEGIEEPDPGATPENTDLLPLADVMRVCAVLEDTIDQLSILNYIMPVHYETRQNLTMKKSKEVDSERKPVEGFSVVSSSPLSKEENKRDQAAKEINKMQDLVFTKPTRQTILTTETLKKIQMDRKFFSDIITDTLQELEESNTYTSLLDALGQESANKVHFYDVISREENGRKQIKSLQKQLLNVKREREAEVLSRSEYIAHLKDQLQEMKAKTNMENRYMKVNSELQVSQTQKKCNRAEELLLEEIEKLRLKTEEENRIHMEIELFLRKEQQKLEEKLEFWMDKFDKDTDMKQNELNALKSAKASDLAHLQDLAKTLQAWWRGTVVRREIGAFRLPRRDKDNGKDSKGKGKDRRGKK